MITLSVNVTKIDKTALIDGKNGKHLALCLFENRDGPDQYGNAGFVTQDIGKERREAGERGPIIGNFRHVGQRQATAPQPPKNHPQDIGEDDSEIPF